MDEDILIPLAFFAAIVLSLYFYYRARNKERLALIEKGMDASYFFQKRKSYRYVLLKTGLFFIGISLGILVGYILEENLGIQEVVSYFSMILLFGGGSLIIADQFRSKNTED